MSGVVLHLPEAETITCRGFCSRCGHEHTLGAGPAIAAARELWNALQHHGRLDFDVPPEQADSAFSLELLHGPARGQMFGVLAYEDGADRRGVLRAFSGQYNSLWRVPGWVDPLPDIREYQALNEPEEARIKSLSREMQALASDDLRSRALRRERLARCRELMLQLHALYRLRNFRGQEKSMAEVFLGGGGMPAGTGDCCSPKLLQHAALHGLRPLGLVEFYYGRANRSETRRHGQWYPSCEGKCAPILGFMLCGLGGGSDAD
ncbi:MAG: hypothetical protein V3573_01240 [Desulfovibrionaceae bacterium]